MDGLPEGAEIIRRGRIPLGDADRLMAALMTEIPWESKAYARGRQPRETAYIGDAGATYRYSGLLNEPGPWTPATRELRAWAIEKGGFTPNSCLLNRYRDGADKIGWHSDDEPELGPDPMILSISLGATRTFWFRPIGEPNRHVGIELPHGACLLMRGGTQRLTQHCILPEPGAGPRINLTFRTIVGVGR